MHPAQIKQTIDFLLKDREELERQIEQIDLMVNRYRMMLKFESEILNDTRAPSLFKEEIKPLASDSNFPFKAKSDDQVVYLFEKLGKFTRLPDVQSAYSEAIGSSERTIINTARRMKNEGKLVAVKYNNINTLSFWGLPSWTKMDENNEKVIISDYTPSEDDLPRGHNTYEFL